MSRFLEDLTSITISSHIKSGLAHNIGILFDIARGLIIHCLQLDVNL